MGFLIKARKAYRKSMLIEQLNRINGDPIIILASDTEINEVYTCKGLEYGLRFKAGPNGFTNEVADADSPETQNGSYQDCVLLIPNE